MVKHPEVLFCILLEALRAKCVTWHPVGSQALSSSPRISCWHQRVWGTVSVDMLTWYDVNSRVHTAGDLAKG